MRAFSPALVALGLVTTELLSQASAPTPRAPAITLLLQGSRNLDAAALRTDLAKALGIAVGAAPAPKGAWLATDGPDLVGGRDGATWRLRSFGQPLPLSDALFGECTAPERQRLESHRAHLIVTAEGEDPTVGYRLLGGVAATLLREDVIALRAAHHEAFVLVRAELGETLLGPDPLRALAPTVTTSLVVFLTEPRRLEAGRVRTAMHEEFGIPISDAPDPESANDFVVGERGIIAVKVQGQLAILSVRPQIPADPGEELPEPVERHRALLHVSTVGPAMPDDEAARRRMVARIVAALWGPEYLGINWHCDRHVVACDDLVRIRLRGKDPVAETMGGGQAAVVRPGNKDAMAKAIAEARKTWRLAVTHHEGGGELSAKFPFATRSGGTEHIWIAVTRITDTEVHGELANDPVDVAGLVLGAPVVCKLAELSDWFFLRDGKIVGGTTIRVLEEEQRRKRRAR